MGEVKLFAAEATGPLHDKVHPRISVTARWIGGIYVALTLLCIVSLMICGMDAFDAVNYAMCTTATGGYGTHSDLLHDFYRSPAIEYVLIFFMFVSCINYTLIYYTILKGKVKKFFGDAELKAYLIIVVGASLICAFFLMFEDPLHDVELALRQSFLPSSPCRPPQV